MKKIINFIMLKDNKILQKILLPIEFILSILCIYSLYRINIDKSYIDTLNVKHLMIFIPTFIIIIYLITFNIKNNKNKIEKIVIGFLIPISLLYVFFMIPTYAPDENAHIWRAYEISTGKLITPIREDGTAYSYIPEYFRKYEVYNIEKYSALEAAKLVDTDYNNKIEVDNPARTYPTILYIFSSIAFFIGRVLNINGMFVIYLARIFNTIVFLLFSYYSIKIIPFGKKVITAILFLPMMLQQCTSISVDCLINSISIFYISYTLYIYAKNKKITQMQMLTFTIISIIIAISKIAYCPLVGICFIFIGTKNISKKTKNIFIPTVLLISAIMAIGYYMFMGKYPVAKSQKDYMDNNNVNQSEQIQNIINNPEIISSVLDNSIKDDKYLRGMIGIQLGWLNIDISSIYITAFLIILVLSPLLEKNEEILKKWHKVWFILIFIAIYWLVFIALYLSWTKVGYEKAEGVQGRYFLPILPLLLLSFCKKERFIKFKNINVILPIILSILNIFIINELYMFFI